MTSAAITVQTRRHDRWGVSAFNAWVAAHYAAIVEREALRTGLDIDRDCLHDSYLACRERARNGRLDDPAGEMAECYRAARRRRLDTDAPYLRPDPLFFELTTAPDEVAEAEDAAAADQREALARKCAGVITKTVSRADLLAWRLIHVEGRTARAAAKIAGAGPAETARRAARAAALIRLRLAREWERATANN